MGVAVRDRRVVRTCPALSGGAARPVAGRAPVGPRLGVRLGIVTRRSSDVGLVVVVVHDCSAAIEALQGAGRDRRGRPGYVRIRARAGAAVDGRLDDHRRPTCCHCQPIRTVPLVPSTCSIVPSATPVMPGTLSTAGMPSSRATIAAWLWIGAGVAHDGGRAEEQRRPRRVGDRADEHLARLEPAWVGRIDDHSRRPRGGAPADGDARERGSALGRRRAACRCAASTSRGRGCDPSNHGGGTRSVEVAW